MKTDWKEIFRAPPEEGYIKNCSKLITLLFFIGGIIYYPTNGYGTVIVLAAAFFVMVGQKLLISQITQDLKEMIFAKNQFEKTHNPDFLRFIELRCAQILRDNKVLSNKAKNELQTLQKYAHERLVTFE